MEAGNRDQKHRQRYVPKRRWVGVSMSPRKKRKNAALIVLHNGADPVPASMVTIPFTIASTRGKFNSVVQIITSKHSADAFWDPDQIERGACDSFLISSENLMVRFL